MDAETAEQTGVPRPVFEEAAQLGNRFKAGLEHGDDATLAKALEEFSRLLIQNPDHEATVSRAFSGAPKKAGFYA